MKTIQISQITDADRPFVFARGQADGMVTLYYAGDTLPTGPAPAEVAAQIALREQRAAERSDARAYAKLQTLAGMSPTQIATWVNTNVTTLADAKDAIKTLAIAVGILARDL